jgi:putative membrane protein
VPRRERQAPFALRRTACAAAPRSRRDPFRAAFRAEAETQGGGSGKLKKYARAGVLLATLAGLAAAVFAFGSVGFENVLAAALRVGPIGFVGFCLYTGAVFLVLGGAWLASAPGEPVGRVKLFAWARLLREAAADLLPFSQIGGLVIGARALTLSGISSSRVYASMVVDQTTEMASQLVYTLFGLAMTATLLGGAANAAQLRPLIFGGTAVMIATMAFVFIAQRPALVLAEKIAGRFVPASAAANGALSLELRAIYARRGNVACAFALNMIGWVGSGLGAWIVLKLMGVRLPVGSVLALEALIFTLRSVAFVVPSAIGVQEAGYALAGPLFGLPPESALALSLIKRAREIAIGLPTLLIWQASETRAVLTASREVRPRP